MFGSDVVLDIKDIICLLSAYVKRELVCQIIRANLLRHRPGFPDVELACVSTTHSLLDAASSSKDNVLGLFVRFATGFSANVTRYLIAVKRISCSWLGMG